MKISLLHLVAGTILGCGVAACSAQAPSSDEVALRSAYQQLIDAENRHDLRAVAPLVADSQDALFVAKAPVGWQGYWGKQDIMEHFQALYQHPFRIDPDYSKEKIVFLTSAVAETYVPVNILAAYGHFAKPSPFIMVLLWVKQQDSWKMITDIPIPIPQSAATPSPSR